MSSLLADREYREHPTTTSCSLVHALPPDGLLVLPALGDQQGVQHYRGQQWEIMSVKRIQVLLPHEGEEGSRKLKRNFE